MDFGSILKTVAPWIGTALTGGAGPLVGMAISAAASALGASDKTADGIKAALAGATPEQMLALKQADQGFALQMQELGFKDLESLEAIAAGDRKDARAMQVANRSNVPAMLSGLITVGFFGILVGMMLGWLKVSESQALLLLLGSLSTAWGCVVSFWFGTTHDSGKKTDLLAQSGK
jgi:hypothetical protein